MKWLMVTCAVCSAAGFFTWTGFSASGFYLGYGSPSIHNCISVVIPLLVAAGIFAWRKRRLALVGMPDLEDEESLLDTGFNRQGEARTNASQKVRGPRLLLKEQWFTPTSAAAAAILVVSALLIKFVFLHDKADHVRMEDLRNRIWPAERKGALDLLQIRQSMKETFGERIISLRPFATAALSDPVCWFGKTNFATLEDLPRGLHTFAGVPFAITERVQLMGNAYKDFGIAFPSAIRSIPLNQKCRSLYLLHGASFLRTKAASVPDEKGFMPVLPVYVTTNMAVARVVLHYADGQQSGIEIFSTQHLLDVWGPICTSEVPLRERCVSSPESELAWASSRVPDENRKGSIRSVSTKAVSKILIPTPKLLPSITSQPEPKLPHFSWASRSNERKNEYELQQNCHSQFGSP